MIVVKDMIGNDGIKDVFLKRHYSNPFFQQSLSGNFVQASPLDVSLNTLPNNCAFDIPSCNDVDLCVIGVINSDDWNDRDWKSEDFKREAKSRGISCGVARWK